MSAVGSRTVDTIVGAQTGHMAAREKHLVVDPPEDYEYVGVDQRDGRWTSRDDGDDANGWSSYESLPPNFSLAANMAAGAFAGIAVREE